MRNFGSGQTSGLPLVVTATAAAAGQVLHTAPVGSATPERIRLSALNLDTQPRSLYVGIYNSGGTLIASFESVVPYGADAFDVLAARGGSGELVLNGASVIKVWADVASKVAVSAIVDNQADVAGIPVQSIASGLFAAVQNATRYAVNAQGGSGQATRANAELKVARAGVLRNLRSAADAAVGTTAVVTVGVYVNGVLSALSNTHANADGTADKVDTDAVAVAAGDLITFGAATTNVAPAANIHACVEYVPA